MKTPLQKLKREAHFHLINDGTLMKILTFKVEQLEPAFKRVKSLCNGAKYYKASYHSYPDHEEGTKVHEGCSGCTDDNFKRIEIICSKMYM